MSRIDYTHCPVCDHQHFKPFLAVPDHSVSKEVFELVECSNCGFVFTQNVPSEDTIGPYYQSEAYISHSDSKKGVINRVYHRVRQYMLNRKWKLISGLTAHRTLLDIGCGTGYFPDYMQNKGFEVTGVEKDPDARKTCKDLFGLDVLDPDVFLDKGLGKKFGAITLWHVLEHLHQLNRYLETMHKHLEDDGILVIAVPNHDSLDAAHYKSDWAAYDVPLHLWHFTPSDIDNLAEKHGFNRIRLTGMPFDPFYNSLLSEQYKKNPLYLISGFIWGKMSFLKGWMNPKKASSVIYVLKKKRG
ncbi:class I SAM-dependent methyltransferase [bacterium SCSIO 12741]|nr:class I SAM-dependent methyltransferase [bacterium SCSIO 12741]